MVASARLRGQHGVNVLCIIVLVLGAVCRVDLVVEFRIGHLQEGGIFVHAARLDMACVTGLGATEPRAAAALIGPDVEVVANAHDPDRHRFS